jgi:hypothetical protein
MNKIKFILFFDDVIDQNVKFSLLYVLYSVYKAQNVDLEISVIRPLP